MRMEAIRRAVGARELRLLARLRELVEVESPSEDAAAVTRAGDLVEGWAADLGGRAVRHEGGRFGPVLELWFGPEPTADRKPVLLLGHLDTVWPMGTLATMPWREDDGKLFGPGVVDMKAGVVMALEAVAALRELGGVKRPVCLLLNPDEEVGSSVSREHTERLALLSEAVFVLEPAQGLAYKTARKGVGHWELNVEGVGAHAGVDFAAGHSAIRAMADLVTMISGWTEPERGLTVNVGTITGGTRSNVVPAHCRAEVDARVETMADAARIEARFAALRLREPFQLTVSGGINRPPMERGEGTVKLFRRAQGLAKEIGAGAGGGLDGRRVGRELYGRAGRADAGRHGSRWGRGPCRA